MKLFIFTLLFSTVLTTHAQDTFSISGTVKDEKGETIPGATIFLSGSSRVTASKVNGEFRFGSLIPGTYELVVKMMGFTPYTKNITIQQKSTELTIVLKENSIGLTEVVIKGAPDPNRPLYLKMFREYFMGWSPNALKCEILNPEVLHFNFNKQDSILRVSSDELLTVENRNLGYRLNYLIIIFKLDLKTKVLEYGGSPYFEELEGSVDQQKQWEYNRQRAYEGSIRHFFKASFNNTAEAEGFLLYQLPDQQILKKFTKKELATITPIKSGSLFSALNPDFRLFKLPAYANFHPGSGGLYIIYTKERESYDFSTSGLNINFPLKISSRQKQVSQINALSDIISIDRNGMLNPAKSFSYYGYWAWERVADLVPIDYSSNLTEPTDPGETSDLKEILAAIDTFHTKAPAEKVHIHFDKPYYAIGDTIWMKAYVVNAENNQLSDLSKILYVDLIDGKDSIRTTLSLPLISGLALGDFALNETLSGGNYRIRAYTNWMRNFSDDAFFDKIVPIGNSLSKAGTINTGLKPAIFNTDLVDLQFFPESGQMVDNIRSKIAFKALSPEGLGIDASGYITDSANNKVTEIKTVFPDGTISRTVTDNANNKATDFKTEQSGMEAFYLTPLPGHNYTAVVKFANNPEKRVLLPKALSEGYVLSSTKTDAVSLFVEILASKTLIKSDTVTLVAQTNGVVQYVSRIIVRQPVTKLILPKSEFSAGILQLTLFSPQYEPVAERLVFIRQPEEELKMTLSANKAVYAAREKVGMVLETTDGSGSPVSGSFSVAVTDLSKVAADEEGETTILSNLLLSSDLKGYIEKPNYYFTNPQVGQTMRDAVRASSDKEMQLDNLMLTQGRPRFDWENVLSGTFPALAFKAEKGLHVSGKLTNANGRPVANGKITILFNTLNTVDTISNEKGEFSFRDFDLSQGTSFHVLAQDSKGSRDVNMILDKMVPPPVTIKHPAGLFRAEEQNMNPGFRTYVEASRQRADEMQKYGMLKQNIALEAVTITAEARRETIKKIALQNSRNLMGPGKADQVITFADFANRLCNDLYDCLPGRLAGVNIVRINGEDLAYSRGGEARGPDHAMNIYIDGRLFGKALNSIPVAVSDISSIEVLKGATASVYGLYGADGVIIITTKNGGVDYNALADEYNGVASVTRGTKKDKPQEYYFGRQFYSPVYNTPKTNGQMPDLRTTIYWNADLVTGADGKVSFDYFTADSPGTYRVVIEGLDYSGRLGRKVFTYTVK